MVTWLQSYMVTKEARWSVGVVEFWGNGVMGATKVATKVAKVWEPRS
jgi:hypothetical protein